ncbi:MAG: THUMP-like domain-containing protein [Dermatophilaceae bacterium]
MNPELVGRLADGDGVGARLLAEIGRYAESQALATASRLRAQGHDADLVAAVLAQARLRARAEATFGDRAATMLFTADGLEQATRPQLAARHAQRFAAAGIRTVHDLTCGIGSDAMAFAAAGLTVEAVDADPTTAAIASANLRPWPLATVRTGQAEQVALPLERAGRHTGVWLDPGRRSSGAADSSGRSRRVFALHAMSPTWSQVLGIAATVPATGAKLSPSFAAGSRPPDAEAQWTSWRGEVLECALWWGPLARLRGRSAAVCRPGNDGRLDETVVTEADAPSDAPVLTRLDELAPWLYEADKAIVRAGLTGALVAQTDGTELARGVGLVSSSRALDLPIARRYAVHEAMPLHVKALRAWCRERGIGRVTVKKRGSAVDPDVLRRQLTTKAPGHAVLLVTRAGGDTVVLVLEPPRQEGLRRPNGATAPLGTYRTR